MEQAVKTDDMEDIIRDFIIEATEILNDLDQKFVELEKSPGDQELINRIFRTVHTIKGAAGFLGFKQIVDVAHAGEGVLNKLRQNSLHVTPAIMDAILKAVDMLKLLLFHVKEKNNKQEDIAGVISLLNNVKEGNASNQPPQAQPVRQEQPPSQIVEQTLSPSPSPLPSGERDKVKGVSESKTIKEDTGTIRVDIQRLDNVMNMVGELVLSRNRLMRLGSQLEDRYGEDELVSYLRQTTSHLDVITTDLQLSVMKTRMQPIVKVFGKFPRMVRDLARAKGKDVELVLVGEETELDKTIIDEIGDPLVHLVRNSIDHGIETPDVRIKAGKPAKGTLTLSAYQKGSNIFIRIEDDGNGIDVERVREKAVEKGLITREEMEKLSEKEVVNFIFRPGFSTAKEVTDVSGRGVGMDVVKTNITKLNGSIDIETVLHKGSKITLSLPLTLAIIRVLVASVGNEDYAVPLSSVVEIMKIDESEIKSVEGREVIYSRNTVYPLLRLSYLTGTQGKGEESGHAVILAFGEKMAALFVENLRGQEEVVIKSIGEYLSSVKGVSGATITGDGRVVLILDMLNLFMAAQGAAG